MTGSKPNSTGLQSDPRVSIIITAHDALDATQRCLDALWRHTPGNQYEIIVVDNGSTDGTADFLRGLSDSGRIRVLPNPETECDARAHNQGAAIARGEYLLFLNQESEVGDGWLSPLVQTLDHDPYVGAVGSRLLSPDGTIRHAGTGLMLQDLDTGQVFYGTNLWQGKAGDALGANLPLIMRAMTADCLMVRNKAYFEVVGFDEGYWNGNEDTDLCLKLGEADWRLVYRPESTVVRHGTSADTTPAADNQQRFDKRWRGRAHPDYYVNLQGEARPAPNFSIRSYAPPRVRYGNAGTKPHDPPIASVVILTHNALDYTRQCLESVLQYTDSRHEILCVDNASTDGTIEWLQDLAAETDRCRVIYNQENLGYAAGNNIGLAHAKGDYLVLLNSDVVVTEGWLDKLVACAQAHPQAGVVGPVTNSITGVQKLPKVGYDQKTLNKLDLFARMHGDAVAGQDEPALWIVGFCMLIKREMLARIGGLDERYGIGNFDCTDYCLRNFLAGYQAMIATDCFVHHYGGRSFAAAKVDYHQSLETNWEIFKDKWNIPMDLAYAGKFDLESIVLNGFNPVLHYHPLPRMGGVVPIEPTPRELEKRLAEGEAFFESDRIADAETLFRYVLYWNSDDTSAANNLAVTLWRQNKTREASEVLEDLLLQDPQNVDAQHNLAEIRKDMVEEIEVETEETVTT
jgi:GT2 family glycosyltransferase